MIDVLPSINAIKDITTQNGHGRILENVRDGEHGLVLQLDALILVMSSYALI